MSSPASKSSTASLTGTPTGASESTVGESGQQQAAPHMPTIDYLEVYKQRCAFHGVRVNSAVIRLLQQYRFRPVQHLTLSNNYVGPKGFRPLLDIIQKCQTIEEIDLRGNGLDNASVVALCRVLEDHLGIAKINVGRNPISMEAGKALMALVENNQSIIDVGIEGTDIFSSLSQRMLMAVESNHERVTGKRPRLVATKPLEARHGPPPTEDPAKNARLQSVYAAAHSVAQPLADESQQQAQQHTTDGESQLAASIQTAGNAAMGLSVIGSPVISETATSGAAQPRTARLPPRTAADAGSVGPPNTTAPATTTTVTLGAPKPRPPAPATASDFQARFSNERREEVRQQYRRRAEQFSSAVTNSSNHGEAASNSRRAASASRAELSTLMRAQERHEARIPQNPYVLPSQQETEKKHQPQEEVVDEAPVAEEKATEGGEEESGNSANTAAGEPTPASKLTVEPKGGDADEDTDAPTDQNSSATLRPPGSVDSGGGQRGGGGSVQGYAYSEPIVRPLDVRETQKLIVGPEDQFKGLFNLGCRYYNDNNLQAAFTSWNEAMQLATREKNREWMALLADNLQTTSYELLLSQASQSLDAMKLDDANKQLDLAQQVATKARNAEWESEIAKVRRNVLHARFTKGNERAKAKFEEFRNYTDKQLTDDIRFLRDGELKEHTETYVNEYERMLLVKEAIETWADAWASAKVIGGSTGGLLQQVVRSSVGELCHLLEERYYFCDDEYGCITWQHTWALAPAERKELTLMWRELSTKAQLLEDKRWDLLEAGMLGNLYFASHDLPKANEMFSKMLSLAEAINDQFLLGCACFYLGVYHYQRSDFADSERFLKRAIQEHSDLRHRIPKMKRPASDLEAIEGQPSDSVVAQMGPGIIGSAAHSVGLSSGKYGKYAAINSARLSSAGMLSTASDPTAQSQVEMAEVPPLVLALQLQRAHHFLSRVLIWRDRFREALEAHERSLVAAQHDVLYEKLTENFSQPTLDQLSRVSAKAKGPLVYFAVHYRYEWDHKKEGYLAVKEQIATWVVPAEGDFRFTFVDVTTCPSIVTVIDRMRHSLNVKPDGEPVGVPGTGVLAQATTNDAISGKRSAIQTEPELRWKTPLRELYDLLMHPVVDFISAHAAYSDLGMFTVIPSGVLWLVPFAALLDEHEQFLIERLAVSYAVSGTQLKFSQRCMKQVGESRNTKSMLVSVPDAHGFSIEPLLPYPIDAARAQAEAQALCRVRNFETITGTPVDVLSLPKRMEEAAILHIASPVMDLPARRTMTGGMAATVSFDQLGVLHSESIAFAQLPLQIATMSNCNISKLGAFGAHEGTLSWTRAFLGAGASGVVLSQWCTEHMKPEGFMEDLYREMASKENGGNRALALAKTMRLRLRGQPTADSQAAEEEDGDEEAKKAAELYRQTVRFKPWLWAGYIFIGVPQLDLSSGHKAHSQRMKSSVSFQ